MEEMKQGKREREKVKEGRGGGERREQKNGINDHTCPGLSTMHC